MKPAIDVLADLGIVSAASVAPEPWANGLGVTRVLTERLAWRLSIAEIRGRMPFSSLPGIDRMLIPLDRSELTLGIEGVPHRVTRGRGIRFAGEDRVVPSTSGRPASVVNIMVRRALAELTCRIERADGFVPIPPARAATVVLEGTAWFDDIPLYAGTALLASSHPRSIRCDGALLAIVEIGPVGS